MSKIDYDSQAELTIKVIDIAIKCFTNYPPKEFEESHIKQFVNTYMDFKNKVINPEPRFKNTKSIEQIKNDVLIYFQEGTGDAVNSFWHEVNTQKLEIKRTNNLEKILKRGKIKNQNEYDLIIDLYNSYQDSKIITEKDISKINTMILDFESNT
jgi:hypothetical protein